MISFEIARKIALWLMFGMFIVDTIQMTFIHRQEINIDNWYCAFHSKLGLVKASFVKIACLMFTVYSFYSPPLHRDDPFLVVLFYGAWIAVMSIGIIRSRRRSD